MKTIRWRRQLKQPQWRRILYILGAVVLYVLTVFLLYPSQGAESIALVVLPVIATAWNFGLRAGLLAGLLAFPFNALLLYWVGGMDWSAILGHTGLAGLAGLIVGVATGRLHDLIEQLNDDLARQRGLLQNLPKTDATNTVLLASDAEAKLRYNEGLLQQAIRIAGLGIWDWDIPSNKTTWAGEMFRIYGIAPESFTGKGDDYWKFTHPDDIHKMVDNVENALERARQGTARDLTVDPVEVRIIRADGTEITVLGDAAGITDDAGTPVRMVGFLLDITQQKRAEQRRFELAVAKEKNDILQRFLTNLSHDLKTPLSVINASVHLLERLTTPEQQKQQIQIIQAQTDLLESLIQDIMTLSELNNALHLTMQPVDVNNLIRDVETHFRFLAEQGQLTVSVELASGVPPIMGNPEELNRAFIQLVEYALETMPTSGEIRLRTTRLESAIAIDVSDTGTGISPLDLPHIFDAFYRIDKARTSSKGGNGLGLAIVKQIVALHQGDLTVQSTEGVGSTFRIVLPLINAQKIGSQ